MPFDYSNIVKELKEDKASPRGPSGSSAPSGALAASPQAAPYASPSRPDITERPNKTLLGKAVGGVFSFLGDVAKNAVKPVLSTFVQMPRAFVSGVAGIAGREDVRAEYSKPVNVPLLGEVQGLSAVPGDSERYGTKTPTQAAGQALEIASTLVGGKAAGSAAGEIGKQSVRQIAKQTAKEGAIAGALGNAGASMADPDVGLGDVVASGITGAGVGAGLGLVAPIVAGRAKNIWRSIMKGEPAAVSTADDAARAVSAAMPDGKPPGSPPGGGMMQEAAAGGTTKPAAGTIPGKPGTIPGGMMASADGPGVPGPAAPSATARILNPSKNPVPLAENLKKEAADAGFDERVIDLIDGASHQDRLKMQRQVQQAEKASKSRMVRERPLSVAGESVLDRIKYVADARKRVGAEYGEAVKRLPSEPVDITQARQSFVDKLLEDGVKIEQKDLGDEISDALKDGTAFEADAAQKIAEKPKAKLVFKDTRYANDKSSQGLISQLYDELSSSDALSPQKVVTMRQRLFDDMDMGSKQQALSSRVESILKQTYNDLDAPLQNLSPEYAKLSMEYAKIMEALRDVYKLLGKNFGDVSDEIATLRAGEVGARMGGNASADVIRILDQLEKVAIETGMEPTDDVARQFFFADMLDDLYGITQPKSLRGDVARGGEQAIENAKLMASMAGGNKLGAMQTLYERATGKTREDQRQILRKILGMDFKERDILSKLAGQ